MQIVEDELKNIIYRQLQLLLADTILWIEIIAGIELKKGYNALILGEGKHASSAVEGVKKSYEKGETDEFVLPTVIGGEESRIHDNDAIIFL